MNVGCVFFLRLQLMFLTLLQRMPPVANLFSHSLPHPKIPPMQPKSLKVITLWANHSARALMREGSKVTSGEVVEEEGAEGDQPLIPLWQ